MEIEISDDATELGKAAARLAAQVIRQSIGKKGYASLVLATGTSQFETLNYLIQEKIEWSRIIAFHLDEYIGLPEASAASFRKYIKERFLEKVTPLKEIHLINGQANPWKECERLGDLLKKRPVDLALVGIGENGHLGFNDPPADFETSEPFIVVRLDERCRQQQLDEGWFKSFEEVPDRAITMSVWQILQSEKIICSVPESRKAKAVKDCFENSISCWHPASILQSHQQCYCFLDKSSAALLRRPGFKVHERF